MESLLEALSPYSAKSCRVSTGDDTIVDEPQMAVSEARAQVLKLKALKEAIKKLSKGN